MIIASIVAFLITVSVLSVLVRIAPALGLMDVPKGHKQHQSPTPLVGGVGMFIGFVSALPLLHSTMQSVIYFLISAVVLVAVGVIDDRQGLSSSHRFLVQIFAAIMMIVGGVLLLDLGRIFDYRELVLNRWSIPLTIFAVVGLINAINMSDGSDGQAAVITLISLLMTYGLCYLNGGNADGGVILLLVVVISAFLLFNLPHSLFSHRKVFMGDAGSMFLGFSLSWILVHLSQGDERVMRPITAVWIVGLPLADTVSVMSRRLLQGKSPFRADRFHYHHLLHYMGFSPGMVFGFIVFCTFTLGLVGVTAELLDISESIMFYSYLLLFGSYFGVTFYLVSHYARNNPD